MNQNNNFTTGKILGPLLKFAFPVFGAMVLQALYGAVDLYVVGRFGITADVSAVATGAQVMHALTGIVVGLAMGTTILMGQYIGSGREKDCGSIIGGGIKLFALVGIVMSLLVPLLADPISTLMKAPAEAFGKTSSYVSICSAGSLLIVAYNLLGSIFRGMGDSKTPLLSVFIAAVFNIFGDLALVAGLGMGASGAALATVISQGLSVLICLFVIKKRGLPFSFGKQDLKGGAMVIKRTVKLGSPIALQDLMVSASFLVIMAIVNNLGVTESAGVGVAQKVCSFVMLIPSAFSQSLSAFVAQNIGAGEEKRASLALKYAIVTSFSIAIVIASFSFFRGDLLTGIFSTDRAVVLAGWDYLKAYAIDVLLTSWMFCFVGYFNGCGETTFVMLQGVLSAFCIRVPVSFFMSRIVPVSLFKIGLATPCSTFVQIFFCIWYYRRRKRRLSENAES